MLGDRSLEDLPLEIVDEVWKLLGSDSTKNFRLTCKQVKQLSEMLITSANFMFEASPPVDSQDDGEARVAASDAFDLSYTRVASRADVLSRMPRLSALKIAVCSGAQDFMAAVALAGAATRSRVTELCLCSPKMNFGCWSITERIVPTADQARVLPL